MIPTAVAARAQTPPEPTERIVGWIGTRFGEGPAAQVSAPSQPNSDRRTQTENSDRAPVITHRSIVWIDIETIINQTQ